MKKKDGFGSSLTLMLVSAALQTITLISIMLAGISQSFPGKSDTTVQMIYSVALGAGVVGTLVVGKLASYITKKKILMLALLCNLAAGVIGFLLYKSFIMLFIASVLIGFGTGSLPTLTAAIMAEYYEGEARARILSLQGVAVALGGIAFSAAASVCAKIGWHGVYLIYFANIILFALTLFLLPDGVLDKKEEGKKQSLMNPRIGLLFAMVGLMALAYNTFGNNISFLISDLKLGDTSTSGTVTTVLMVGMICGSVVEPYIYRIFSYYTSSVDIILMAAGLVLCGMASNLPMLFVGTAVIGIGFGMYSPCIYSFMPDWATPGTITMTMALYAIVDKMAAMLCPIVTTNAATLMGGNVQTRFFIAAAIGAVAVAVSIIGIGKAKKTLAPQADAKDQAAM